MTAGPVHAQSRGAADATTRPQPAASQRIPYGQQPVDYWSDPQENPVAELEKFITQGSVRLQFDDQAGYLPAILKQLEITPESQLLVYSRTALNQALIGPESPRAIYFNDTAYVAWVPQAPALELAAWDRVRGFVFYKLAQSDRTEPRFTRERRCLACHAGPSTAMIPGLMRRSFETNLKGKPVQGYALTDHTTDYSKRWAGWFVTGSSAESWHAGNLQELQDQHPAEIERLLGPNLSSLMQRTQARYPAATSDLGPHLVFDHQVQGLNLIARTLMELRFNRPLDTEQALIDYLVFDSEARLPEPVQVADGFRRWFESAGDLEGSVSAFRKFHLRDRVFDSPVSFLVTTPPFGQFPQDVQRRLARQIVERLAAADSAADSNRKSADRIERLRAAVTAAGHQLPAAFADQLRIELRIELKVPERPAR